MITRYNSYQQKQVLEAAPEDILLQLLQGAIVRLKQAQDLFSNEKKGRARERRQRAYAIIAYLDGILDRKNQPEISAELEALYAYMLREISESTRKDDFERLGNVQEVLSTVYEGWKEAVAEYKKEQKTQQAEVYSRQEEQKLAQVG